MESIGEFFKQVRETKGLTIDEVAAKTRIRTDFVKALEDGNFAKLPDQVFARGFVRSYARSLGLDEEDAIHRFTQSAGAFYDKQVEKERLKVRQAEEDRKRQSNRKAVAIAIGIAILTLIFLLSREQSTLLVHRSSSDLPASAPKKTTPPVQESQDPTPSQPTESVSSDITASKTGKPSEPPAVTTKPSVADTPEPAPSPITTASVASKPTVPAPSSLGSDGPLGGISLEGSGAPEGQLALDLEATELSWVVIQIDGGSPQEALLRPGEKATWKGQDQFVLTLGNAGGVKAELNGKPQKPFGPSGKVARDILIKR